MYPTTLRGVFPERPPPVRRNFIRENVLRIRGKHDIATEGLDMRAKSDAKLTVKVPRSKSLSKLRTSEKLPAKSQPQKSPQVRRPGIQKVDARHAHAQVQAHGPAPKGSAHIADLVVNNNVSHRSVQTGSFSENHIAAGTHHLQTSPRTGLSQRRPGPRRRDPGQGDSQDLNQSVSSPSSKASNTPTQQKPAAPRVDYIRTNIMAAKAKQRKATVNANTHSSEPNQLPANYKKGVPPKYIKHRRYTEDMDQIVDCPAGHVLLPEEERKETLRVLRESYAEKIQEMNSMPVRSDTLRMQRRKMTLETELQKIDEGIKIFQRPRVFVKVDT